MALAEKGPLGHDLSLHTYASPEAFSVLTETGQQAESGGRRWNGRSGGGVAIEPPYRPVVLNPIR